MKRILIVLCLVFSFNVSAGTVRVFHMPDGSVKVGTPISKGLDEAFDMSTLSQDYEDIDDSALPKTREYRDAWTKKPGGGIKIDTAKKKQIDDNELIKEKAKGAVRKQAIADLKAEGKLPANYND